MIAPAMGGPPSKPRPRPTVGMPIRIIALCRSPIAIEGKGSKDTYTPDVALFIYNQYDAFPEEVGDYNVLIQDGNCDERAFCGCKWPSI